MAIIGRIRKHSGLAVILVGVAIAAFVISDFGRKNKGRHESNIGVIGGEDLSIKDFNEQVDQAVEIQKQNSGTEKLSAEEMFNIRQGTWDKVVKEILFGQQYDKLGLAVSTDELTDQVSGKNPHRYILQYFKDPKTGQYDPALVINYLKNLDQMEPKAKQQWLDFEKAIREDRIETKYRNLITKGYYVPKAFAKQDYERRSRSEKVRLVMASGASIPDTAVKVSDDDIDKFLQENRNIYTIEEENRDMDYVAFEVQPSKIDRSKISQEVSKMYNEFLSAKDIPNFVNATSDERYDSAYKKKGSFIPRIDSAAFSAAPGTFIPPFESGNVWYLAKILGTQSRPDSMKASQILISYKELNLSATIKRTKDEAKKLTDSLLVAVKADPAKFAELARKYSDYPDAAKNGGDLGWFTDGNPNFSPFFEAGLTASPNDVKIKETRLGFHIIRLDGKTKPIVKARVAVILRKIEPSNTTFQDTYNKASEFIGKYKTPEAFEKGAVEMGVNKRAAQSVKATDPGIMGLNSSRSIVQWAYLPDTKEGVISPVFDVEGSYVIVLLKTINEKGLPTAEKAREQVEPAVRNEKKIEMVVEKLKKAMEKTKDLAALAAQFNSKVDTLSVSFSSYAYNTLSSEPRLLGEIMTYKKGTVSEPLKGRNAAYVIAVDDIMEPVKKDDFKMETQQLTGMFGQSVYNAIFKSLQKTQRLKDNRILYF